MASLLRHRQRLVKQQAEDFLSLFEMMWDLTNEGTGVEYVTDDKGIIWPSRADAVDGECPPTNVWPCCRHNFAAFGGFPDGHPCNGTEIDLMWRISMPSSL